MPMRTYNLKSITPDTPETVRPGTCSQVASVGRFLLEDCMVKTSKICNHCNEDKSLDQFYSDKYSKDGLRCECKLCNRKVSIDRPEYSRRYRESHLFERRMKDRKRFNSSRSKKHAERRRGTEKYKAVCKLHYAIASGKIKKPSKCEICGEDTILHGHHSNYKEPLNVLWLCSRCHGIKHRKYS